MGEAHAAPGNVEDLFEDDKHTPAKRVVEALERLEPDEDRVDGMTYKRIVPEEEAKSTHFD